MNDPNFDPTVFHAAIPTGWVVTDVTGPTRRDYFTMPDGSQLNMQKGSIIPRVRPGIATRPDGDPPPITLTPNAAW